MFQIGPYSNSEFSSQGVLLYFLCPRRCNFVKTVKQLVFVTTTRYYYHYYCTAIVL